jgi:hypothetical protein
VRHVGQLPRIQKAVKRLRPTKSVGLNITGFIIKGCSTILLPVLK